MRLIFCFAVFCLGNNFFLGREAISFAAQQADGYISHSNLEDISLYNDEEVSEGNNDDDEKDEAHYVRKPKHLILQATTTAQKQPQSVVSSDVKIDTILNQFYQAKNEKKIEDAKRLIEMAIEQAPDDIRVRKEAGYLLLESHPVVALEHFKHVEKLDPEDVLNIVQIGYILQKLNRQMEAYTQFDKAFETVKTPEEKKKYHENLLNLSAFRVKALPSPAFYEAYFAPFFSKRFSQAILDFNQKFGIILNADFNLEAYVGIRYDKDNRSTGGTTPSIYADNSAIFSVGLSFIPFKYIPLKFYIEGGQGYDLEKRNRNRWRNDFRYGATVYYRWGAPRDYYSNFTFCFSHYGDFYADVSYYSRFKRNWIGSPRIREGIKIVGYKTSEIYLYLKGQYTFDTRKEFYNNIFEFGPGLSFVPTNLLNFALRVEYLKGQYIKVHSKDPNPYSRKYENVVFLCEIFLRL